MSDVKWKHDVDDHDYEAAEAYLSLCLDPERASHVIIRLREAPVVHRRANDILRACRREPLSWHDPGVRRDQRKVATGRKLSPILLVSFDTGGDIADGYHRVSLVYNQDPFATVPLKVASPHPRA